MATDSTPSKGIPRYKSWDGFALFRQGFRPFFLAAGLSALLLLANWVLSLLGFIDIYSGFDPVNWHAHEMIFGMASAAIAGFLLTAVPNWTGRMPLQGWPLIGLCALWIAGRIVMYSDAIASPEVTAIVDVSFLVVLLGVLLREIITGKNWRNLPITVVLGLLAAANIFSHLETLEYTNTDGMSYRMAIAVVMALIALIGGRIIPSFTRNWLSKQHAASLPQPFGKFDIGTLFITVCGLVSWVVTPDQAWTATALIIAGVMNGLRLIRWQGWQTFREPLVWSLHLGFLWFPVGLILIGVSFFVEEIPVSAGLHALTAGAIGGMILAVMTRATLGHSGRGLTADKTTMVIYVLVFFAALTRVLASLAPVLFDNLLVASFAAWCGAFGLFSVHYGRMMLRR